MALAGVGQSLKCWPTNQRVFGSISSLGHTPWVAGQIPSRGHARGNHTLMFPSLSLSLPLSKK